MKRNSAIFSFAVLGAAVFFDGSAVAQNRRHDLNINIEGKADSCADLHVRSEGQLARTSEMFTLQRNEVPVLEVVAPDHGGIRVMGGQRNDFTVDVCKLAVAEDQGAAEQLLRTLTVSRLGGRFSANTPQANNSNTNWQLFFIVHAPSDARVNLETKNGPVSIESITGGIRARSTNGPVSLQNCAGVVDAQTTNGPISFAGTGGDVQLNTTNGPISLKLANDTWSGPRLEAHTTNGPLSLAVPETFQTGMRVETDGHSPMSCRIGACQHAMTDASSDRKSLQLGSGDIIRVSTTNGPISVGNGDRKKIM
jgi:DUF4097 and DUF4098 domain-containing protein YvlB